MKVIPIKGTIVSNDDAWLYNLIGWDCTAPKNVVLPETGEDIEVHINSGEEMSMQVAKSILHYGPTQGK